MGGKISKTSDEEWELNFGVTPDDLLSEDRKELSPMMQEVANKYSNKEVFLRRFFQEIVRVFQGRSLKNVGERPEGELHSWIVAAPLPDRSSSRPPRSDTDAGRLYAMGRILDTISAGVPITRKSFEARKLHTLEHSSTLARHVFLGASGAPNAEMVLTKVARIVEFTEILQASSDRLLVHAWSEVFEDPVKISVAEASFSLRPSWPISLLCGYMSHIRREVVCFTTLRVDGDVLDPTTTIGTVLADHPGVTRFRMKCTDSVDSTKHCSHFVFNMEGEDQSKFSGLSTSTLGEVFDAYRAKVGRENLEFTAVSTHQDIVSLVDWTLEDLGCVNGEYMRTPIPIVFSVKDVVVEEIPPPARKRVKCSEGDE